MYPYNPRLHCLLTRGFEVILLTPAPHRTTVQAIRQLLFGHRRATTPTYHVLFLHDHALHIAPHKTLHTVNTPRFPLDDPSVCVNVQRCSRHPTALRLVATTNHVVLHDVRFDTATESCAELLHQLLQAFVWHYKRTALHPFHDEPQTLAYTQLLDKTTAEKADNTTASSSVAHSQSATYTLVSNPIQQPHPFTVVTV